MAGSLPLLVFFFFLIIILPHWGALVNQGQKGDFKKHQLLPQFRCQSWVKGADNVTNHWTLGWWAWEHVLGKSCQVKLQLALVWPVGWGICAGTFSWLNRQCSTMWLEMAPVSPMASPIACSSMASPAVQRVGMALKSLVVVVLLVEALSAVCSPPPNASLDPLLVQSDSLSVSAS